MDTLLIKEKIDAGLREMDIAHEQQAVDRLHEYLQLLLEWNKTHNLTSVDDIEEMVSVHILDSASVLPYIKGSRLLDIGSGAGLPGMILAILAPTLSVTSVESRSKKAQFQKFAANKLGLDNFNVEHIRVEEYEPAEKFDTLTARAFSSINDFINLSANLVMPTGQWLAMKGVYPEDELKEITNKKIEVKEVYTLSVPELEAQRHLVVLQVKK